jgi:SPW repeat
MDPSAGLRDADRGPVRGAVADLGLDERGAVWALIVLGALLAVAALVSLAMPGVVATEWLTVLFGVLLFVAPWVLTYTDRTGASWTSWVVGVVAVVLGGSSVAFSGRGQQQAIQH